MSFSLFNAAQILSIGLCSVVWKSILSEILDLSPECPDTGTFLISLKKSHKSAHRLQQGVNLGWLYLGIEILKGKGRNEIIVLIVNIVTLFLNAAKPFSLFNATQILSIPARENPAIVFIVLIVLIVTE